MTSITRFFKSLALTFTAMVFIAPFSSCSDDDSSSGGDNGSKEVFNPAGEDGILKVLAIGNSYSEDSLEQYLYELFEAAGVEAVIGNLYHGNCTLEMHYNYALVDGPGYSYRKIVDGVKTTTDDATMLQAVFDEDWDYISFQQAPATSGLYETFNPYLPYLVDYVLGYARNEDVKLCWHQTWAYAWTYSDEVFASYDYDQMKMYEMILSAGMSAVEDNNLDILIPCGTAIQNARNSKLGDTLNRDGYHLEYSYGRFTASCTWFEALTGIDVTTNTYAPSNLTEEQRDIARHAAHYAVQNPYSVNDMAEWQ